MLSIYQHSFYNNTRCLYKDVTFEVHFGQILGIMGSNGAGKSTLLHAIASLEKGISISKNLDIRFLSQENEDENLSVLEAALSYQPHLCSSFKDMDLYADRGGFSFEQKLQKNFPGISLESLMKEYSLGQRQWIRLISLFLSPSEVLLLDEPTNYLDLEHILFFKHKLMEIKSKKIILLVTHDRYLLDEVVDRTLYLSSEEWEIIEGGYTSLTDCQDVRRRSKINLKNTLEKQIVHLSQESTRKKIWANKTEKTKKGAFDKGFVGAIAARLAKKAVQAEQKRSQKLKELKEAKPFIKKKLTLEAESYVVYQKEVVKVENLFKKYDEVIFSDLSFSLQSHDRVALCGLNGCGKSTLIRCLLGIEGDYSGKISWNPCLKWHYLPQGLEGFFRGESLSEHFSFLNIDLNLARKRLGSMLLRESSWDQDIRYLSAGEKMRAALVESVIMESEFLILDEPTNHLDIESLEILDELLESFPGGFLFVSHDKLFLERHANKIIYMSSEGVKRAC